MTSLNGKVAVITGGSSGIGLAIAKRFVTEGAYVFISGRRRSELDNALAAIENNITATQADVSKLEELDRLYETVAAQNKKIDVVVANAAFVELAPVKTATPEHFDQTFDTNARGAFFTVQKALPLMNDGGSIILIASAGKDKATVGRSTYSGTKAAQQPLHLAEWVGLKKLRRRRFSSPQARVASWQASIYSSMAD